MLKMGLTSCLSTDCKTYTFLTSVHNVADKADATDDADDYDRVIGIVLPKAFSCANKNQKGMRRKWNLKKISFWNYNKKQKMKIPLKTGKSSWKLKLKQSWKAFWRLKAENRSGNTSKVKTANRTKIKEMQTIYLLLQSKKNLHNTIHLLCSVELSISFNITVKS